VGAGVAVDMEAGMSDERITQIRRTVQDIAQRVDSLDAKISVVVDRVEALNLRMGEIGQRVAAKLGVELVSAQWLTTGGHYSFSDGNCTANLLVTGVGHPDHEREVLESAAKALGIDLWEVDGNE
jgi:hypothetical protein